MHMFLNAYVPAGHVLSTLPQLHRMESERGRPRFQTFDEACPEPVPVLKIFFAPQSRTLSWKACLEYMLR